MAKYVLIFVLSILPVWLQAADQDPASLIKPSESLRQEEVNPFTQNTPPGKQSDDASQQSSTPIMPKPYPSQQSDLPVLPMPTQQAAPQQPMAQQPITEQPAPQKASDQVQAQPTQAPQPKQAPVFVEDNSATGPEPYEIYFDNNSTKLDVTAKQIIKNAAAAFEKQNPRKVIVAGNADRSGSLKHNMELAALRANAVAKLLIKNGVPENALDIRSYGVSAAWVDQVKNDKDDRSRNVKIIFLKNNKIPTK